MKAEVAARLGVYVHVPFCRTRCRYCDFYRVGENAERQRAYLDALQREIEEGGEAGSEADRVVDTVFFGGGTPSLLEPMQIASILDRLSRRFDFAPDAGTAGIEITMEANPSDLDLERLEGYRAAGVNRLSLGVQSLADRELTLLGRRHDAERAAAVFGLARAAGFENLSLDLMLAIPGQTEASFHRSLAAAIDLAPDHMSLYLLEVHAGSEIDFLRRERPGLFPGEEAQRRRYLAAVTRLEEAGFEAYEISNFSRPGRRSRHNLKYWNCEDVLGFGPAAHSLVGGRRFRNPADLRRYLQHPGAREEVESDLDEERLFLGLRLADGVPEQALRRAAGLGESAWRERLAVLAPFVERMRDGGSLRLTPEGRVVSTPVIGRLLETSMVSDSREVARDET